MKYLIITFLSIAVLACNKPKTISHKKAFKQYAKCNTREAKLKKDYYNQIQFQ